MYNYSFKLVRRENLSQSISLDGQGLECYALGGFTNPLTCVWGWELGLAIWPWSRAISYIGILYEGCIVLGGSVQEMELPRWLVCMLVLLQCMFIVK